MLVFPHPTLDGPGGPEIPLKSERSSDCDCRHFFLPIPKGPSHVHEYLCTFVPLSTNPLLNVNVYVYVYANVNVNVTTPRFFTQTGVYFLSEIGNPFCHYFPAASLSVYPLTHQCHKIATPKVESDGRRPCDHALKAEQSHPSRIHPIAS